MELDDEGEEDEQLLREILKETQAEQKPDRFGSTRTRQPRRPSQYGHASSEASSPAPVDKEEQEDDDSDDEDPSGAGVEEHESVGVAQEQFKKERRELRDKKIVVRTLEPQLWHMKLADSSLFAGRSSDLQRREVDAPRRERATTPSGGDQEGRCFQQAPRVSFQSSHSRACLLTFDSRHSIELKILALGEYTRAE